MFLQNDLEAISNMLGVSEVEVMANTTLENEYMLRLRMYHRVGNSGVLPPGMLIDCLRFCGLEPPVEQRAPKQVDIDWRKVKVDARVIVQPNPMSDIASPEYGVFRGKGDPGELYVLLDRDASENFATIHSQSAVMLADGRVPLDVKVDAPEMPGDDDEPVEASPRASIDRNDPEGPVHQPKLSAECLWLATLEPGTPVMAKPTPTGRYVLAEFFDTGPKNNQVQVIIDGKDRIVEETWVKAVESDSPKQQPVAKAAPKKRGRPKKQAA